MEAQEGENRAETRCSNLSRQMQEVARILREILVLFLQIISSIGEATYRSIVRVDFKPIKGEIVLITGAGHGMGKELALLYASEGATVIGWDVNMKNNEETISQINQNGFPKAYAYYCDVSNRENVFEAAKKVREDVGDVTILINNAGIMPTHPLLSHTKDEIDRIFAINVLAHFWTLQAFLPAMKRNRRGHVVAMSSCAGLVGFENLVPYCGSKFAVIGAMEALQEELRVEGHDQIGFTTICPSMVDTGLCKRPRVRFQSLTPVLSAKSVARRIMEAQRTNAKLVTVPGYIQVVNKFIRLFPYKAQICMKDFFDSGVDSDL